MTGKNNKKQCALCSCWKISDLLYQELQDLWIKLIGGPITPGYLNRYLKRSGELGIPVEEVKLPFKYCAKGKFTRFYFVKSPTDTKPVKEMAGCPSFTSEQNGGEEIMIPSPFWSLCQQESHGQSSVEGQSFYPGLVENFHYSRIPAHGKNKPLLVDGGTCSICGREFSTGIMVKEITTFCCNKHYLEWWKVKHPEMYAKLNRAK